MRYEIPSETFDKSYYRNAISSFDPISIEMIPDWLRRIEDAEMTYKNLYYEDLKVIEAWTQFRKTIKDFLNWFNGLLEAHGYDRFLNENNYWKLQRIVKFDHVN